MYKKDLDNLLKKHTPRLVFLYGESDFFIDFYAKILKDRLTHLSFYTFYFEEFDITQALDILSSGSLFDEASAILLKIHEKIPKEHCQSLLSALAKNPKNHLIIAFYRASSKSPTQYMQEARLMASALGSDFLTEVRFFHPSHFEAMSLMRQRCADLGLVADDHALQSLLAMQNQDLSLALNELEKYCLLDQRVDLQQVRLYSYGLGNVGFEDFLNAFFERGDFLLLYEKMKEESSWEAMDFLRELERYFYTLFLICAYAKIHGSCNYKEILGYVPPQAVLEVYTRRALSLKEGNFQKIFEILQMWRNGVFQGKKDIDLQALIQLKAFL